MGEALTSATPATGLTDQLTATPGQFASTLAPNELPDMSEIAGRISRGEISREAGQTWSTYQGLRARLGAIDNPKLTILLASSQIASLDQLCADPARLDGASHQAERRTVLAKLGEMEVVLTRLAGQLPPSSLQASFEALTALRQSVQHLGLGYGDTSPGSVADSPGGRSPSGNSEAIYDRSKDLVNVAMTLRQESLSAMLANPMYTGDVDPALRQLGYTVARDQQTGAVTVQDIMGRTLNAAEIDGMLTRKLVSKAGNELATYEAFRRNEAVTSTSESQQELSTGFDVIIQSVRMGHGTDTPLNTLMSSYLTHVDARGESGSQEQNISQTAGLTDQLLSGQVQVGSLGADEQYAQQLVTQGILRVEGDRYVSAMSENDTRQARQMFQAIADPHSNIGQQLRQQVQAMLQDRALMDRLHAQVNANIQAHAAAAAHAAVADSLADEVAGMEELASSPTVAMSNMGGDTRLEEGPAGTAANQQTGKATQEKLATQATQRRQALDRLYDGQAEEFQRTLKAMDHLMPR
jgi:hypothetical protein